MSEEKMESVAQATAMDVAIDESGAGFTTMAGGNILEIQYHSIDFQETGQAYVTKRKTITPPNGWRRVSVSVAQWDLSYGHATYEKALVSHMAVSAGVRRSGSSLEISAQALMREPTSAPGRKWAGKVNVQAIFIG